MRKIMTLLAVLALIVGFTSIEARAQTFDYKTKQFIASDYASWSGVATTTVITTGTTTISISMPNTPTVPGGSTFNPFVASNKILVDVGSSQETVSITSSSCGLTAIDCTITGTIVNTHTARYPISSGTYGLLEAISAASVSGGGVVVIPYGSPITTAMITASTILNGSTSIGILDLRGADFAWYLYNGTSSNYALRSNVFDATAPGIDLSTTNGSALQIIGASYIWAPTSGQGLTTNSNSVIATVPAGAILLALTARVTTALGATNSLASWSVQDRPLGSTAILVAGTGIAIASGTTLASSDTVVGSSSIPKFYGAQTLFDIKAAGGNFDGTGAIRFTWYYLKGQAPIQ